MNISDSIPVLSTDELTIRVIYGDTDAMGFVYYANYLRYFEAGRTQLMRKAGVVYREMEDQGYFLPVAEVRCRYKKPARFDDLITIRTSLLKIGGSIVKFGYEIIRDNNGRDEVLCTGETTHICISSDGRPQRLPESIVDRFIEKEGE